MPNPNDPALTPPNPVLAPCCDQKPAPDEAACPPPDCCPPPDGPCDEMTEKLVMAQRVQKQLDEAADKHGGSIEELCRRACMSRSAMEAMVEKSIREKDEKERTLKADDIAAKVAALNENERGRAIHGTKLMRVNLDAILQDLKSPMFYNDVMNSAHRDHADAHMAMYQAQIHMKNAIMWLGMMLKAIGTGNPYPNSYKPENSTVDPTADGLKL